MAVPFVLESVVLVFVKILDKEAIPQRDVI